jgi:uncharacterized protein (DUF305 family)
MSRSSSQQASDVTASDELVDTPTVSDADTERILRWFVVGLAVAVVAVGFFALARWATAADKDDPPLGAVDIGFLQDMLDHHDQALLIAQTYLDNNPTGDARPYASEVIMFQTIEIGRMEGWLADEGLGRGAPNRQAMTWMNEPTPIREMPGMQTTDRIAELAAASGPDSDALFFEIMSAHHLGSVHMADFAASGADTELIRTFAAKVSYNQQIEVVEYDRAVERLNLR